MKIGDKCTRLLAGIIPMEVTVEKITDTSFIVRGGWSFCRRTGVEIDDHLNWGPEYGATGSYIKNFKTF